LQSTLVFCAQEELYMCLNNLRPTAVHSCKFGAILA